MADAKEQPDVPASESGSRGKTFQNSGVLLLGPTLKPLAAAMIGLAPNVGFYLEPVAAGAGRLPPIGTLCEHTLELRSPETLIRAPPSFSDGVVVLPAS
jgi:hypothetical protein